MIPDFDFPFQSTSLLFRFFWVFGAIVPKNEKFQYIIDNILHHVKTKSTFRGIYCFASFCSI